MSTSPHIFAIHDPGPWFGFVRDAGKTGWCVYTEGIGHDPNDHSGGNYEQDGITPIVRLNNAYGSGGCLPHKSEYHNFAKRCANFVANSRGCKRWQIGNELLQLQWEWPDGVKIELADYIEAYNLCYDAIKVVQPDAEIISQPVATWNNLCAYPGNERGDWVQLMADQLKRIGPNRTQGISLHAYAKGYSQDTFHADNRMNPPFQDRVFNFGVLWEFMRAIPSAFRHLPVYLTETNGDERYPDHNSGWIQGLYREINHWNSQPGNQKILCATLFRSAPHDEKWTISNHSGSIDDFRQALQHDYRHNYQPGQPSQPVKAVQAASGKTVRVTADNGLNLRAKPVDGHVIELLQLDTMLEVIAQDGDWLNVKTYGNREGFVHAGYVEVV